jgi:hypothetical protein
MCTDHCLCVFEYTETGNVVENELMNDGSSHPQQQQQQQQQQQMLPSVAIPPEALPQALPREAPPRVTSEGQVLS